MRIGQGLLGLFEQADIVLMRIRRGGRAQHGLDPAFLPRHREGACQGRTQQRQIHVQRGTLRRQHHNLDLGGARRSYRRLGEQSRDSRRHRLGQHGALLAPYMPPQHGEIADRNQDQELPERFIRQTLRVVGHGGGGAGRKARKVVVHDTNLPGMVKEGVNPVSRLATNRYPERRQSIAIWLI